MIKYISIHQYSFIHISLNPFKCDYRADTSMPCHLWTTLLGCEAETDFIGLLGHCKNELHLPAVGKQRVFERAGAVMKQSPERINLCLHWDHSTPLSEDLIHSILQCLTHINTLRYDHSSTATVMCPVSF